MSSTLSVTGKTRFRTVHRGIWPFRWSYLVLQVEVQHRIELYTEKWSQRPYQVTTTHHWRDAKLEDLSMSERRELFCRENPR